MVRSKRQQEADQPPNLVMAKAEAYQRLEEQMNRCEEIKQFKIYSEEELEKAKTKYHQWNEYNYELLSRMFDNRSIAEEYRSCNLAPIAIIGGWDDGPSLSEEIKNLKDDVKEKLAKLISIKTRLELIPVIITPGKEIEQLDGAVKSTEPAQKIFVVYGHDITTKLQVSNFLTKLELDFTILDDIPNRGRTIIEKFEQTANEVGYAIVLLTADDVGGIKDTTGNNLKPRARQNAIFELGYFIGKLGRSQVCALCNEIELPSDYQGVLYIKLSDTSWELKLAKEMRQAGIMLDANKLL